VEFRAPRRYLTAMRVLITLLAAVMATPLAAAGGPIGTLTRGTYACELPGSAAVGAGRPQPDAGFVIENASRYSSAQGSGTYLRRGDTIALTSGPRRGESYAVVSDRFLRRIEDGKPGRLRCIRAGR
jgi:hypothetical protein